jgi:hypothetical protein
MGLSVDSIIKTSVACAIGPSVNTFFNFHIFINQTPEILVLSTFPIDLQIEALN